MRRLFLTAAMILTICCAGRAQPESAPIEELAHLEQVCLGTIGTDGMLDRLAQLENLLWGCDRQGLLGERLDALKAAVFNSSMNRPSLLFELNAIEWALNHRLTALSLLAKLAQNECLVFGEEQQGTMAERVAELAAWIWPTARLPMVRIDLTARTLVKIELATDLSSTDNEAGDVFVFSVVDNIYQDGILAVPAGSRGKGRVIRIVNARNMGRDAQIVMDFGPITTLDGTPVRLTVGEESLAANNTEKLAVQVTTAGMIALGPAGILSGLFVRGRETYLPAGTTIFVQTADVTPCFTLGGGV